jgi:hypothetical protein
MEIEAIANNPKALTFENTIAQMERAGMDFGVRCMAFIFKSKQS